MSKITVLFICIHNSARSQMAEAFVNHLAKDRFIAESAGLEPGKLNPLVVDALKEIGIDISRNRTKSVDEFIKAGKTFDYIITVCDETSAERCPVFPGNARRSHFSFPDPSAFQGSYEEKLKSVGSVRDAIQTKIVQWLKEA